VPRELERVYPASQYDIPVTGEWDSEEINIAAEALTSYLSKFDASSVVVVHLAEGYLDVAKEAESRIKQSIIYTSTEGPVTSVGSLEALQEVLKDLKEILSFQPRKPTIVNETLRATADYQFGEGASNVLLPENTTYSGKLYRSVVCRYDNLQTCTFVADNGLLSLTLTGGRMLAPMGRYWVRFEGKRMKGGSIFAVGVQDADEKIRPGDEVIVINNDDEVIAVGRSEMSGREMCQFTNGRAVSVRHQLE
jgi:archaeosine synthase